MEEIKKEQVNKFIDENRDILILLKRKTKTIDTVKGCDTIKELMARQKAIKVINEWLNELWGIKLAEIPEPEEDDDIFRIINN